MLWFSSGGQDARDEALAGGASAPQEGPTGSLLCEENGSAAGPRRALRPGALGRCAIVKGNHQPHVHNVGEYACACVVQGLKLVDACSSARANRPPQTHPSPPSTCFLISAGKDALRALTAAHVKSFDHGTCEVRSQYLAVFAVNVRGRALISIKRVDMSGLVGAEKTAFMP